MTLKKNTSYAISLCVLESLQKNYSWSFYFHHTGSASLYLRSRAERNSLQVSEGTITFFTLFLIFVLYADKMSILLTEILYRFFSFFHLDFSFQSNTWIEQIEGCIR